MAREVTFKLNLKIDGKDVVKKLTVDVEELQRALESTRGKSELLRDSFIKFNQVSEAASNISGAISQMASSLDDVTAESRSFGGAMAAANTMAGKSGEEFANMKDQVAELSHTIPIARDELANGLYQVISNGVPEGNWIQYLEQSAKASVGGIADLGETVKVTSTIIKNYGLEWSNAGSIQDKIQLTAKNGVTSFEQLAQALPRVTSSAATLGVSIDELMATFSTLTGVSGNTAEVSTQLAAIFTALIKPSSEASEMAQQMGIQFDAAAIKAAGGMSQFLASLDKSVKQYAASSGMLEQEIYGKLFGSAESLRAITPLTNQLADKFRENVAAMQGSVGTIDEAFNTMASTGGATLQMLNNKLGEYTDIIQSSIGNVAPYLNCAAQVSMLGASMVTLSKALVTVATSAKVTAVAVTAYNKAIAIALGVSTAPLAAMAAALGVLAVGYSNVKSRMEDTDREARNLRATIADLKQKQDENVASIRKYLPVAQDATKSVKDRKDAIIKLKQLYPDYFKNLDIATSKQYNIEKAVNAANRAYRRQLVLIAKQAKAEYEKAKALRGNGQSGAMMVGSTPGLQTLMDKQELAEIEAKKKAWEEAEKAVKDYDKEVGKASPTKKKPVGNTPTKPKNTPISKMSYQQVADAIEKTTNKLKAATPGSKEAKQLDDYNKKLQARKKILEGTYSSLNTNKSKGSKSEPKFYKNPKTSEQYEKNINYYQGKLTDKNTAEDQRLRKQIQLWKDKKAAIDAANLSAERPLKLDSVDAYNKDIGILQQMVNLSIDPDEGKKLQKQLEAETRELGMLKIKIGIETVPDIKVKKNEKAITQKIDDQMKSFLGEHKDKPIVDLSSTVKTDGFSKVMGDIKEGWGNIQGVGGGIQSITDALDGNKNAWQALSGVINGFISIAEGIQGIVQFVNMLTTATQAKSAATTADTAVTAANTAVTTTNTAAKAGEAITNATASGAKLPFPANIAAIAAGVAAVVAALAMISGAFADGGVVGGNSPSGDKLLARVNSGEMILNAAQQARLFAIADGTAAYGASAQIAANFAQGVALPSVSVQTDRLQGILADGGGNQPKTVEWRLRGRDIVASIANETRSNRKRSNIRIK